MIEKHLRPIAQAMLQARVDGKLKSQAEGIGLIGKYQPRNGWAASDIKVIANFGVEIKNADNIPNAKMIAEKYNLDILY